MGAGRCGLRMLCPRRRLAAAAAAAHAEGEKRGQGVARRAKVVAMVVKWARRQVRREQYPCTRKIQRWRSVVGWAWLRLFCSIRCVIW